MDKDIVTILNDYAREGEVDKFYETLETIKSIEAYSDVYNHGKIKINEYRKTMMETRRIIDETVIYSMRNEQIYLSELVKLLNEERGFAIDIGAGDGINWSNVYHFLENGWDGLLIEGRPNGIMEAIKNCSSLLGTISFVAAFIDPFKINKLLASLSVPENPTILSVDIDSLDFQLVETLLFKYRPKILIVEINERLPPPIEYICSITPTKHRRDLTLISSASLQSWSDLLTDHHYGMYRLEYNNLISFDTKLTAFRSLPKRTPNDLYNDFTSLKDKNVLFPWNNIFFQELLVSQSEKEFYKLPINQLENHFKTKLVN